MYWSDFKLDTIETADLNGTGRTVLLPKSSVDDPLYLAIALDAGAGIIYIADQTKPYD